MTTMNDFVFTPSEQDLAFDIPYFEDAKAEFAPYYSSSKTISNAKAEIRLELSKLEASVKRFQEGHFGIDPKRYGYQISFFLQGAPGVIRVAGLPIRKETDRKIERVQVQALLNVRDWIKASVTQPVFSPGSNPLMMNMLVPGSGKTIGEYLLKSGNLALPIGEDSEVFEGEFTNREI